MDFINDSSDFRVTMVQMIQDIFKTIVPLAQRKPEG